MYYILHNIYTQPHTPMHTHNTNLSAAHLFHWLLIQTWTFIPIKAQERSFLLYWFDCLLFWFLSFPHNSWLFINISLTVSGLSTLWRQTGSEDSRFPPVASLLHSSKSWGNRGNWLRNKEVCIFSLKAHLLSGWKSLRCGVQLQIAAFPMLKSWEETHICELSPSPPRWWLQARPPPPPN